LQKPFFLLILALTIIGGAQAPCVPAWAQPSKPSADSKADPGGFAGLLATVNKNPNNVAQLDHVRLLSTDKELDERVDIDAIHKYIVTACATVTTFFNNTKHGKPIGLSVNCDLLPGGQAVYQLQVRPVERQDTKLALGLNDALQKVKVPAVTGPISLQILMKVWYPKADAMAFFKKGFALQKADKNQEAVQQYSQAIAIDPTHTEAYTCRAMAYNALGEYDKAIADLTQAISLGSHDAYLSRAYAYRHLKDADNAMADCNRAIEHDPRYWEGYVSRAELWVDKGNYAEAIKDCDTVLQFMSTCGYAYLVKGEAHLSLKQPEEAIKELTMATEILPKSGECFHYRAEAHKALGQDDDAAADENHARELGYTGK
jgi:tetratricopeptide (TPR) repeat protein